MHDTDEMRLCQLSQIATLVKVQRPCGNGTVAVDASYDLAGNSREFGRIVLSLSMADVRRATSGLLGFGHGFCFGFGGGDRDGGKRRLVGRIACHRRGGSVVEAAECGAARRGLERARGRREELVDQRGVLLQKASGLEVEQGAGGGVVDGLVGCAQRRRQRDREGSRESA